MTPQRWHPWIAGFLCLLHPGLGHVYLRRWGRFLGWLLVAAATVVLLFPEPEGTGIEAVMKVARNAPLEAHVAFSGVSLLSAIDAFTIAQRPVVQDVGPRCPACGRTVETDVDFCIWCTEPLPDEVTPGTAS